MYGGVGIGEGGSLIPYFDYYLGMAIIADKARAPEIREDIRKLYVDLWSEKNLSEIHLDGYKDFEK